MAWLGDLLRRARIRGLTEGKVQTGRTEATEHDAKDEVERWQDYGFAANPVDGQGLVINVAGHTIVLRMDRISERPQLAAHEVSVWHKEGHMVTLKAGRLVQVDCASLVVNASAGVTLNTPTVQATGALSVAAGATVGTTVSAGTSVAAPAMAASQSLKVAGKEMSQHTHSNVQNGPYTSGPPA